MSGDRFVRVLAFIADHAAAHDSFVSSQMACDACVHLIGVNGAGLILMNGLGRGESRYSTNAAAGQLEELQFTLGEGPSMDAFRSGMPVLVSELDSHSGHERWPMFTPAAVDAGVRAVFVFPLRSGAIRLGVLVLHSARAGPLTLDQVSDALVITDVIRSLLLDELTPVPTDLSQWIVDGTPLNRAEVHQATGMVSAQLGVTMEEALVRMRAYAFAHELPIADVAREIVARRLRLKPSQEPDPA